MEINITSEEHFTIDSGKIECITYDGCRVTICCSNTYVKDFELERDALSWYNGIKEMLGDHQWRGISYSGST